MEEGEPDGDTTASFLVDGVLVMAGGAVGSLLRWLATLAGGRLAGPAFPLGTVVVNVAGAAALGLLLGALPEETVGQRRLRLLLGTGGLGGLTTFSTWSGEIVLLARGGAGLAAAAHLAGTLALGLAGFLAGLAAGGAIARAVRGP